MNKFKNLVSRGLAFGAVTLPALVFAEGEQTQLPNPLENVARDAETYIGVGKDMVVTLLGAGLVIVVAFWIWRLLKKTLGGSK